MAALPPELPCQDLMWTILLPCWSFIEMLHPHRPAGRTILLEAVPVALPWCLSIFPPSVLQEHHSRTGVCYVHRRDSGSQRKAWLVGAQ